jgi:hypothetical protein
MKTTHVKVLKIWECPKCFRWIGKSEKKLRDKNCPHHFLCCQGEEFHKDGCKEIEKSPLFKLGYKFAMAREKAFWKAFLAAGAILLCLLLASSAQAQHVYPEDVRNFMINCGVYQCAPSRQMMMVLTTATNGRHSPKKEDYSVTVLRLQFEAMKAYSLYLKENEPGIRSWMTRTKTFVGPMQPVPKPTRLEMIGSYLVSNDARLRYLGQEETSVRVEQNWIGVRLTNTVASWTGLEEKRSGDNQLSPERKLPINPVFRPGDNWLSPGVISDPKLLEPDFSNRMTGK